MSEEDKNQKEKSSEEELDSEDIDFEEEESVEVVVDSEKFVLKNYYGSDGVLRSDKQLEKEKNYVFPEKP